MKPSSRFVYALKALVDLTLHQGTGPVTMAVIAKRQGIPVRSLEQLFNRLGRAGLVIAERGPRGGYRLKRSADQVSAGDLFELLERRKVPTVLHTPTSSNDPARAVWRQVEEAVRSTLGATTLESLAAMVRDQVPGPASHSFTFHI